jgi:hypothetical protein
MGEEYRVLDVALRHLRPVAAAVLVLAGGSTAWAGTQVAVLTHHNDIGRTGWNANETVLTPDNVGKPGGFGPLATIVLDGRTDAQPLVVPGIKVAKDPNAGTHDVVYAATENNTVYAIDPVAGKVLLSHKLGTPVQQLVGCNKAYTGVGIQGTPVIDTARNAMYVIAAVQQGSAPSFVLHMLDLSTLADKVAPVTITATQTLANGQTVTFNPLYQKQRPALLETNNTIYAGFGSICDFNGSQSCGWVLGWKAGNLQPLLKTASGTAAGALANRNVTAPNNVFLSSIWMSGAGLAADTTGLYFITGNSDSSGTTYDGVNNTPNSVLRLSLTTLARLDLFTPGTQANLDQTDTDFGAGGIMLLPSQGTGTTPLATAAGKSGTMYLLSRDSLGGYTPGGPDNVLATAKIGRCVCAQSYFAAPTPTIVSSGQNQLVLWHFTNPPGATLTKFGWTGQLQSGTTADTSFFTSVSSSGTASAIVWTVMKPSSSTDPTVRLNAYSTAPAAKTNLLPLLYDGPAGSWSGANNTANLVPVVANGRVYVASDKQLVIFGLLP